MSPAAPQHHTKYHQLLCAQRDNFTQLLALFRGHTDVIQYGSPESIAAYAEQEEAIVERIRQVQTVIEALPKAGAPEPAEVTEIEKTLQSLRQEAVTLNKANQEQLRKRMSQTAAELQAVKSNPFRKTLSPYAQTGVPSYIDITL